GLNGAKVQLENLSALVNGAIAFDSPADSQVASQNDDYHLYEDLAHSQRGVVVTLDLPYGDGLKAGSTPLMYQGSGDDFLPPHAGISCRRVEDGLDFEGEFAVVVDEVPQGCSPQQ
uniref:hypothetical protein n=1 Tax=Klebsiella pneumoniae TaxID=573 RepID=UPI001D0EBDFE